MKSRSMTIRFVTVFLAAFLAAQVSPLCASSNQVRGIDIVVKKEPGGALQRVTTDSNGTFSVRLDAAGTYQITAMGGGNLSPGDLRDA